MTIRRRAAGRRPTGSRLLISAAAGYGKSVLLRAQRPEGGVVVAARSLIEAGGLPESVTWIGVDDFDDVAADDQDRLIALLTEREDVGFAIASRSPIVVAVPGHERVPLVERDASDLALQPYAVARLLADKYGITDPEAALRVADLTAGWPTLVRFAADALSRNAAADLSAAFTTRDSAAAVWIRASVLSSLPTGGEEVLRTLTQIDAANPLTDAVCAAIGGPSDLPERLRRAGVLVPRRRVGRSTELVVVPALALLLRTVGGGPSTQPLARAIAGAYETERAWLPAARAYAASQDRAEVARLICERGEDMLRSGGAGPVTQLVDQVIGASLDDEPALVRRTYADALRMIGDTSRSRRAFAPLVAAAGATAWPAGLAVRVAGLHYLRGEFESALAVLDRSTDVLDVEAADRDSESDGEDVVDWWACRVHVLDVLGRVADAQAAAIRCLEGAEALGRPRALGVAHLAVARTYRGTLKDLHNEQALRYAIEAGDAVNATRTLAAQTWRLLAAARYDQARHPAREAVRMARLACPPGLQAAAIHNLSEALARTGDLDEALWHFECSIALCRRLGRARAALGLVGTGDIHRSLGHGEQSRAAYTEAAELARGSGDTQVLVAALCGQALLAADEATPEAEQSVAEALRLVPEDLLPLALTTAGRLAATRGDRAAAADHARRAVIAARTVRATDLLADALELESGVTNDPGREREALTEALAIWSAGGARPAVARVEVLIGRLPDADSTERSRGRDAARALSRLGIAIPGGGSVRGDRREGMVFVDVLGPFTATVNGREVPLPAWRSRQARTLVKILAGHRGRVVTRERLCDLLWPDDDPARTGHRLSVLLATVRGVLDPGKAWPVDRYIAADQRGLRLDLGTVVVDAELLLRDAARAGELSDGGESDRAREVLTHVNELYRGDAFSDEIEEWAEGLREEVRAAWMRSMRRLAALQAREGRGAEALGILARLLSVDPYDEQVHRRLVTGLVRAGRHGEARRAFERWTRAMQEIDAPLPDPRAIGAALGQTRRPAVLIPR